MLSRHGFSISTYLMHAEQTCIYGAQSCSAYALSSYLHPSVMSSRHGLTSPEAPVNNVDNYILLLFRHLVIAGKTKPSTENIGSYVHSRALYISICAASAIPLNRDKRVRPLYRLHMHGLPNPSTYQAKVSKTLLSFNQAEHTIFSME